MLLIIFLLAPLLAAILPALIGGAAAAGGAAIQRGQSKRDIEDQNRYNTPAAQLGRLREAGLPFAAFEANQAGSQSALPETNDMGGQRIGDFVSNQTQLKMLELLDAQIAKTEEEAHGVSLANQLVELDPYAGEPVSYGARKQKLEILTMDAERVLRENRRDIEGIELEVKRDLQTTGTLSARVRQELENLVTNNELNLQAHQRGQVIQKLIMELEKGGMSVGEAFIHAIITGGIGASQIR